MPAPLDHATGGDPHGADALGVEAGDITYAALLDRHAAEEPITDEMVRRACLRMESAQSWPFVPAARERSDSASEVLARLFRVRR